MAVAADYYSVLGEDPPPSPAPKKKRAKRGQPYPFEEMFPELPETAPKNTQEPKYISIQSCDPNKPLQSFNVFIVKKGVDAISQAYTKPHYPRDGSLVLLCNSEIIARRFTARKKIADIAVTIALHDKLNSSKGTVYCRSLINLTEKEILDGLKSQGVTEVVKMTREREGEKIPTGLLILSFNCFTPPKHIIAGFERIEVRQYIPNPMRCRKCQLLGHTTKRCTNTVASCPTCGNDQAHAPPCTRIFCLNCKMEGHTSNSSACPKYILQKEFLKIKTQQRCSLYEAKKLFYKNNPIASLPHNIPTYQQVLRGQTHDNNSTAPKQTDKSQPLPTLPAALRTNETKYNENSHQTGKPTQVKTITKQITPTTPKQCNPDANKINTTDNENQRNNTTVTTTTTSEHNESNNLLQNRTDTVVVSHAQTENTNTHEQQKVSNYPITVTPNTVTHVTELINHVMPDADVEMIGGNIIGASGPYAHMRHEQTHTQIPSPTCDEHLLN